MCNAYGFVVSFTLHSVSRAVHETSRFINVEMQKSISFFSLFCENISLNCDLSDVFFFLNV